MAENETNEYELCVKADLKNLETVAEFIQKKGTALKLPPKVLHALDLAVDEAATNVMTHAYAHKPKGMLRLLIKRRENDVLLVIEDQGSFFDLDQARPPDLTSRLEDRKIGGLGVFFIHQMMDKVSQEQEGETNRLILCKSF